MNNQLILRPDFLRDFAVIFWKHQVISEAHEAPDMADFNVNVDLILVNQRYRAYYTRTGRFECMVCGAIVYYRGI